MSEGSFTLGKFELEVLFSVHFLGNYLQTAISPVEHLAKYPEFFSAHSICNRLSAFCLFLKHAELLSSSPQVKGGINPRYHVTEAGEYYLRRKLSPTILMHPGAGIVISQLKKADGMPQTLEEMMGEQEKTFDLALFNYFLTCMLSEGLLHNYKDKFILSHKYLLKRREKDISNWPGAKCVPQLLTLLHDSGLTNIADLEKPNYVIAVSLAEAMGWAQCEYGANVNWVKITSAGVSALHLWNDPQEVQTPKPLVKLEVNQPKLNEASQELTEVRRRVLAMRRAANQGFLGNVAPQSILDWMARIVAPGGQDHVPIAWIHALQVEEDQEDVREV